MPLIDSEHKLHQKRPHTWLPVAIELGPSFYELAVIPTAPCLTDNWANFNFYIPTFGVLD